MSALIDIYSDETLPYDINFRQGGYLAALVDSVEGVRKAVRAIDRSFAAKHRRPIFICLDEEPLRREYE